MRLSYLDSSRGLAALIVFFAHFQLIALPWLNDSWIFRTPIKFLFDGEAAVLYFFILSGFVLTHSLKNEDVITGKSYFRFITKRFFRIYPAFLFVLILSFILLKAIPASQGTWLNGFWKTDPTILDLLRQSLLVIRVPNEPELRILPHDWTLSIEFALSFLLPVLAIASRKNPAVVLVVTYTSVKFLRIDPFVFDFALGIFIAQAKFRFSGFLTSNKIITVGLIIASVLICIDYSLPGLSKGFDKILIHHKSWGLAFLLLLILSNQRAQNFLSLKPMIFSGRISYSFYLVHLIVLFTMTSLIGMIPLMLFISSLTIALIASTILFYSIEKPFVAKGKQLLPKS